MLPLTQRPQTLEAVARLVSTSDGVELLKWITDSREEQRDKNEQANGNDAYRGNGRSLELSELKTELEDATETLQKLRDAEAKEQLRISQQGIAPLG